MIITHRQQSVPNRKPVFAPRTSRWPGRRHCRRLHRDFATLLPDSHNRRRRTEWDYHGTGWLKHSERKVDNIVAINFRRRLRWFHHPSPLIESFHWRWRADCSARCTPHRTLGLMQLFDLQSNKSTHTSSFAVHVLHLLFHVAIRGAVQWWWRAPKNISSNILN